MMCKMLLSIFTRINKIYPQYILRDFVQIGSLFPSASFPLCPGALCALLSYSSLSVSTVISHHEYVLRGNSCCKAACDEVWQQVYFKLISQVATNTSKLVSVMGGDTKLLCESLILHCMG